MNSTHAATIGIRRLLGDTWRESWARRRDLALPLAMLMVICYASFAPAYGDNSPAYVTLAKLLLIVLSLALFNGLHRAIVLAEPRRGLALFCFNRSLWRLTLTSFKLTLAIVVYSLPPTIAVFVVSMPLLLVSVMSSSLSGIFGVLGALVVVLALVQAGIMLRQLPALSAAALGKNSRLGLAWRRTRGQSLRLLGALLVLALPWLLPNLLALALAADFIVGLFHGQPHVYAVLPAQFFTALGDALLALSVILLAIFFALAWRSWPDEASVTPSPGQWRLPLFFTILFGSSLAFFGLILAAWLASLPGICSTPR